MWGMVGKEKSITSRLWFELACWLVLFSGSRNRRKLGCFGYIKLKMLARHPDGDMG